MAAFRGDKLHYPDSGDQTENRARISDTDRKIMGGSFTLLEPDAAA